MEYKVKDRAGQVFYLSDGSFLSSCGSDGENICGVDYTSKDGKHIYCLSFRKNDPYSEVLARLFDSLTQA